MKIISIRVVNASEFPERTVNTEMSQKVKEIAAKLQTVKVGDVIGLYVEKAKKWQRYSLQKRLQKAGCKCLVAFSEKGDSLLVKKVG